MNAQEMDKVLSLARKVKELADRGVDGERESADGMLKKLMAKHNLTLEMIVGDEIKKYEFFILPDDKKFFIQILASVLGQTSYSYLRSDRKKKKSLFIKCTPSEAVEIQGKFEFYLAKWKEELELFYSAFVQKQKIYTKPSNSGGDEKQKPLTPEEKAKLYKMANYMEGMNRHHYVKQLKEK